MARKDNKVEPVIDEAAVAETAVTEESQAPQPPVADDAVVEEAPPETNEETTPAEPPAPALPEIGSRELVNVRLDGAPTAVLGGKSMFRGDVRTVTYATFLEAHSYYVGKFSVKYPGSTEFVRV